MLGITLLGDLLEIPLGRCLLVIPLSEGYYSLDLMTVVVQDFLPQYMPQTLSSQKIQKPLLNAQYFHQQ